MTPLYSLHDVRRSFGQIAAVDGVDLEVQTGEFLVVAGPSGSGKTTLLQLLGALDRPTGGRVEFEGKDLARMGDGELAALRRDTLGFIFQQFNLIPTLTAAQNVEAALAPRRFKAAERHRRANALLDRVGLAPRAGHLPSQLSGGEQQRVAIARALAMDPKLMLFDEPTSALDPEMIREVLDVMRDLARDGMTMLVVTHEMGFAREVCDRLVFIDGGLIVEEGPPAEFFANARSERAREFVDKIIHH